MTDPKRPQFSLCELALESGMVIQMCSFTRLQLTKAYWLDLLGGAGMLSSLEGSIPRDAGLRCRILQHRCLQFPRLRAAPVAIRRQCGAGSGRAD